ncbi:hypothetical protein OX284_004900 [Flavobacterium sp. SUN046]|uniref:hypothetical protein n=1 Tax=Flavobacterium sp. SUN046 TaxID=3002440 RepID=UPI002DB978C4|nr:hypothetical protein [Flavobacterium sp. SUN046]MEC4048759.1 hypothetical protein [Flavobacterium sp. SUN046]
MAYNVAQLADYTNEQALPLLKASILGAKTAKLFQSNLQTGIKHSQALNIMNVEAKFMDDSVGSDVAGGGNVTFTQRVITVAPIAVREFLDPRVLNTKWMNYQAKAGSANDELVFEKEILEQITMKVAENNEKALWMSDTNSSDSNLNKYDGFVKIIDNLTGTTVLTGSSFSSSTALGLIDSVYSAIPAKILSESDTAIFMGWDYFRVYTTTLKNANLFHYGVDAVDGELTVPGTSIKIYALNGLNGSKRVIADRISNYFIGTDLDGEEDNVTANYIDQIERVKVKVAFKYGVQLAFPDQVTVLKLAA